MEHFMQKNNIENLMHFTRAENLNNIIKYGILSIEELESRGIKTIINDSERMDYCTSASSVSIEFPNYKMLYELRMKSPKEDWVIICLKAKLLIDKKCVFCYDNAANEAVSKIPIDLRCGLNAFKSMFMDIDGQPTRKERNLKRFYTTMPQAEILIVGNIEIKYFKSIIFKDRIALNKYKKNIPTNIKYEVIPDYFYAREDYRYW